MNKPPEIKFWRFIFRKSRQETECGTIKFVSDAFQEDVATLETREYNGFNEPVSVCRDGVRIAYRYRPDGLRYGKTIRERNGETSSTIHLWDGQNIVAEVGTTGSVTARYLRGINLIAREQDGENQYYLFNAHGDVTQRVDAWGNVLKAYRYDAFGNEQNPEKLDSNPFRYCGEYFDKETGEIYLRARYYNPAIGRFANEDTVREITRELPNGQKVIDPLGLNLYTYCHNNPIMFFDPSGHASKTYDLGKGWTARIEDAHVPNGKGKHVVIEKGNKQWAQNDDGSAHDKSNNSPGSPPTKVLERLNKQTGWDWVFKMEQFADQVDIKISF